MFSLYSFSDTSYLIFVSLSATVCSKSLSNSLNLGSAVGSCFNLTFTSLLADIFTGTVVFIPTDTVLYSVSVEVGVSFVNISKLSLLGKTGHFPSLQQVSLV